MTKEGRATGQEIQATYGVINNVWNDKQKDTDSRRIRPADTFQNDNESTFTYATKLVVICLCRDRRLIHMHAMKFFYNPPFSTVL